MARSRSIFASVVVCALAAPFVVAAAPITTTVLGQTGAGAASASAPAAAGSASPDDIAKAKEEAKEHFLKGVTMMQEEQWDAALVEFKASLQMFPTRNARKNAAVCLRQLGRFAEALDEYEMLLKEFGGQLPPADAEQVNKAIADLKNVTGFIVIESSVAGATVIIDSKPRGTTPLGPIRVGQGTHTVRVLKEGYVPFETTQAVLGKQTVTIPAKLEVLARSGSLQVIEETGAEADVIVDGAPKGKTGKTPYSEKIGPGNHWVALRGPGNLGTQPAPVNVQVDQTFTLRLKLEELPAEARIETDPVGAAIVLDGVPVGQGSWEGRLRLGAHKVDATSEGYFRTTKTLDAKADGKTTLKISLDRDENSPFWTQGRTRPISFGVFGSGVYGLFGFGGDYEKSCNNANTNCYDRSKPVGFIGGARAGYEIAPGLSLELDLGYAYVKSSLSRTTRLLGEQSTPVKVDITDEWSMSGFLAGVGASYRFLRKPLAVYGAITGGVIFGARVRDRRGGDTPCLTTDGSGLSGAANCSSAEVASGVNSGTQRSMLPDIDTVKQTFPWFAPEIRIAYPITDSIQIGLSFGAFIGITDARPKIIQTPQAVTCPPGAVGCTPDPQPKVPDPTLNCAQTPAPTGCKAIGFVPQPNLQPESAIGTFILPRTALFVRLAF
ncbi:MAG: PEGA domain-containing protein [Deltaproteobacteria bacterium]|nr:PEGA domain-containing protein [Deltaproteobacteria bacterium]